jgi:hypothetical protein
MERRLHRHIAPAADEAAHRSERVMVPISGPGALDLMAWEWRRDDVAAEGAVIAGGVVGDRLSAAALLAIEFTRCG